MDSLDRHTKFINMKSVIKALENPDLTAKDMHDEWMNNKIETVNKISYSEFKSKSTCKL